VSKFHCFVESIRFTVADFGIDFSFLIPQAGLLLYIYLRIPSQFHIFVLPYNLLNPFYIDNLLCIK
ncbi:hypothetical protein HAX54_047502, partial [Datura stramonium]|nr:hypothetical protein [Datura stramonium]